eukprot:6491724-Amphidinium_carterae.2
MAASSHDLWDAVAAPASPALDEEVDPWSLVAAPALETETPAVDEWVDGPLVDWSVQAPIAKRARGRPKKVSIASAPDKEMALSTSTPGMTETMILQTSTPGICCVTEQLDLPDGQLVPGSSSGMLQKSRHGRAVFQQVAYDFWDLVKKTSGPQEVKDDDIINMARMFLSSSYHVTSHVEKESLLGGMETKMYHMKLNRLASSIFLAQGFSRYFLEKLVVNTLTRASLLSYIDMATYDESSMQSTVRDSGTYSTGLSDDVSSSIVAMLQALQSQAPKEAILAKIFQVRPKYGMLLKFQGICVQLNGSHVAPLQALESTSGEIVLEALQRQSHVSFEADSFQSKSRVICSDQAGSNIRAEKGIQALRGDTWSTCWVPCAAHRVAACFKKTFDALLPGTISGLVNATLSLQAGIAMMQFRQCVKAEIERRLVLLHAPLDADALKHKVEVLKTFACDDKSTLTNHVLLLLVFNGNWHNFQDVEYILSGKPGSLSNKSSVVAVMVSTITSVALHKPILWPRHRWTKSEKALDFYGLLHHIHGLLIPAYEAWLLTHSGSALRNPLPQLIEGNDTVPLAIGLSETHIAEGGVALHDALAAGHDVPDAQANPADANTWQALNARHRREAKQWMDQDSSMVELTVARRVLEPLRALLEALLFHSGAECKKDMQAELAQQLAAGQQHVYKYPVVLASELVLERRLLEAMKSLLKSTSHWSILPANSLTISLRGLIFRLISRASATVHQLLVKENQSYPIRTFQLLNNPDKAVEMEADADCKKDVWSLGLQRQFGFASQECKNVLNHQGMLMEVDISGVEARHASVRRQLNVKSVQTNPLSFTAASCEWVFQNYRTNVYPSTNQARLQKVSQGSKLHSPSGNDL